MEKRVKYLDLIKFFAIYCVLLGHAMQFIGKNFWSNPVWEFIYSFHLPLFMIISGYFFSSSLQLSFGSFLRKKTAQLILPPLVWYFILCLLYCFINPFINEKTALKFSVHGLISSFWFLKSLFGCYLIVFLSMKLIKNQLAACLITCIALCLIPFGDLLSINFLLPFFWIGFFFQKYRVSVEKKALFLWKGCLVLFALSLIFWNGNYTIYNNPIELLSFSPFHFAFDCFQVMLFRFFIGLVGSFFFIFSIQMLYKRSENNKLVDICCVMGKYTLGIYLLQMVLFERLFFALALYLDFLPVLALTFVILGICLWGIKMIERNKYTQLFLLGSLRKNESYFGYK
ncbi:acyltransferase family protein [uncultured Bacteroides sp.]|uniref:acyltransferase family protein n=1 Tax=uncultured Bacteroides sp. TaxID=162156 RepID=UPI002AABEB6D|nr:acyltransferase family protein [uncultured Bacteroides sp.]